jgi:hypothetical protein
MTFWKKENKPLLPGIARHTCCSIHNGTFIGNATFSAMAAEQVLYSSTSSQVPQFQ